MLKKRTKATLVGSGTAMISKLQLFRTLVPPYSMSEMKSVQLPLADSSPAREDFSQFHEIPVDVMQLAA